MRLISELMWYAWYLYEVLSLSYFLWNSLKKHTMGRIAAFCLNIFLLIYICFAAVLIIYIFGLYCNVNSAGWRRLWFQSFEGWK